MDSVDKRGSPLAVGAPLPRCPDLGLFPPPAVRLVCGKIREDLSTSLCTDGVHLQPIHISEGGEMPTHIWGCRFPDFSSLIRTSPQRKPLIHRYLRVIHSRDGRDGPHRRCCGFSLPLNLDGILYILEQVRLETPIQSTNIGSGLPSTGVGVLTNRSRKAARVANCSRTSHTKDDPFQ